MATTISISDETKERLRSYGRAGESYEDVIKRMLEVTRKELLRRYLYDESDSVTLEDFKAEIEKQWPKSS